MATLRNEHVNAELALTTLSIALKRHKPEKGIILHRDQGKQFTSRDFNVFYEKNHLQQSVSRAGYTYDNAPMERFYKTLKNKCFNLYSFHPLNELERGIYEFVYVK